MSRRPARTLDSTSLELESQHALKLNLSSTQKLVASSIPTSYGGTDSSKTARKTKKKLGFWKGNKGESDRSYQRLIDRNSSFYQSFGTWNVLRSVRSKAMSKLFKNDPFHNLLHMSTWKVLMCVLFLYIMIIIFFGLLYLSISMNIGCNMDIVSFREAYYFSLETMTTVGYGTTDIFFASCWSVMTVMTVQACSGLLIDALLIGLLFARLGRPQTRASTVVFSNKAVIRRVRGENYFMFQIGELRKHQLLTTNIRCYAIRHHRTLPSKDAHESETVHYQMHNMRLQHPDDELGGNLLLVIPQVIVHRIDAWSPLMPPPRWVSNAGLVQWGVHEDTDWETAPWEQEQKENQVEGDDVREYKDENEDEFDKPKILRKQSSYWNSLNNESVNEDSEAKGVGYVYRFPDLLKRWDDVDGSRGTWYEKMKQRCTILEHTRRERALKAKYRARGATDASNDDAPSRVMQRGNTIMKILADDDKTVEETSSNNEQPISPLSERSSTVHESNGSFLQNQKSSDVEPDASLWFAKEEKLAIDTFLHDREVEVIVVLEGTEISTGNTVQCRYSYTVDDIVWNHSIAPCVIKDKEGKCVIDFDKFHDIRPAPPDSVEFGFIQSYA